MASFSIEDFVGNGSLKELLPKLLDEGWDDVPTLKVMNAEDMDDIGMTRQQKVGFLIKIFLKFASREGIYGYCHNHHFISLNLHLSLSMKFPCYVIFEGYSECCLKKIYSNEAILGLPFCFPLHLHDRALMRYGDQLEASGKGLPELLGMSNEDLSSQLGMKRGHIARFMDRTSACAADHLPTSYTLPARRRNNLPSRNNSIYRSELVSANSKKLITAGSSGRSNSGSDFPLEQSIASFKIKDGYVFKGIVAAMPAEPRACGCVQPPPVVENVAPYSTIENISVQKLTPEYKIGMERLIKSKTPPMKAAELWREKPSILLCIRRPGFDFL